jgi:hypothetical protein
MEDEIYKNCRITNVLYSYFISLKKNTANVVII